MGRDIILASSSRYRGKLLSGLGLSFQQLESGYEEVEIEGMSAEEIVMLRSCEKARKVYANYQDCFVIGSDQGVGFQGRLLGKGGDFEGSFRQLKKLSGQEAVLYTGLCVICDGEEVHSMDYQQLFFRVLRDEDICRYLHLDEPYDCAGSFKIEGGGALLFEKIVGEDPRAIEGLALMSLVGIMKRFDVC